MRYIFHCYTVVFISLTLSAFPFWDSINGGTNPPYQSQNTSISLIKNIHNEDAIIGKWMTIDNSLEVEVYKQGNDFKARVIWFKIEDTTRPMNTRTDDMNPNPKLRTRKWLGMEVLRNLKYNAADNEWRDGIIYDAKHGKEWDSVVWINKNGLLKVKGYWVFRWISETLTFKRVG
jgi:uncharacterized protein (DUF2147 family)